MSRGKSEDHTYYRDERSSRSNDPGWRVDANGNVQSWDVKTFQWVDSLYTNIDVLRGEAAMMGHQVDSYVPEMTWSVEANQYVTVREWNSIEAERKRRNDLTH